MLRTDAPMVTGRDVGSTYCAPRSNALVEPEMTGTFPQIPVHWKRSMMNLYVTPALNRFPTGVAYESASW